jgi:hypothetical protein
MVLAAGSCRWHGQVQASLGCARILSMLADYHIALLSICMLTSTSAVPIPLSAVRLQAVACACAVCTCVHMQWYEVAKACELS